MSYRTAIAIALFTLLAVLISRFPVLAEDSISIFVYPHRVPSDIEVPVLIIVFNDTNKTLNHVEVNAIVARDGTVVARIAKALGSIGPRSTALTTISISTHNARTILLTVKVRAYVNKHPVEVMRQVNISVDSSMSMDEIVPYLAMVKSLTEQSISYRLDELKKILIFETLLLLILIVLVIAVLAKRR